MASGRVKAAEGALLHLDHLVRATMLILRAYQTASGSTSAECVQQGIQQLRAARSTHAAAMHRLRVQLLQIQNPVAHAAEPGGPTDIASASSSHSEPSCGSRRTRAAVWF